MVGGRVAPASARVCDAVCLAFAGWTLCANAVVLLGGHLQHLLALAAFAAALGAAVGLLLARRAPAPAPVAAATVEAGAPVGAGVLARHPGWVRAAGAALGLAAVAGYAAGRDAVMLWWAAVCLLAGAALATPAVRGGARAAAPRRRGEWLLWGLGAGCALFALAAHRHDLDDSFYVNVAVSAADAPTRALLATDTLRGIPGLPFSNPTQRAQSYELLNGALSYLSGIPAIYCFHWISAAAAALLAPLAWVRLLRVLTPGVWPWTLVAVLAVLAAAGDTHRAYGNFALVRIWQGKAIFLTVALPLVYAYALRFAQRPAAGRWALLCAAQIAAVGLTSTALWAAPLASGLALCAAVRPDGRGLRTIALGALASAYTLGTALLLKAQVPEALAQAEALGPAGDELAAMLTAVLGRSHFHLLAVFAILCAWAARPPGRAQRFAIAVPLGALLLVANPYTEGFVRENLTGPTQWRAMWALPVPLLVALLLCAPLELDGRRSRRRAGRWATAAAIALALFAVPQHTVLGPGRAPVRFSLPALKVDARPYGWAHAIRSLVPAGSTVLAPSHVNPWIPTLHGHPYPLEVRPDFHWDMPDREEAKVRFALTRYVTGELRTSDAPQLLREGIARYPLSAVCFVRGPWAPEIRDALREGGLQLAGADRRFELWVAPPKRRSAVEPER